MNRKTFCIIFAVLVAMPGSSLAGIFQHGRVQLLCHRTANADVPENTLESLQYAALMGCDVVEIDLTRTLDGQIVLHHDGLLERLSDGMGVVEQTYSQELALMNAGSWMAPRFGRMNIPKFEDAVRLARDLNIGLYLDFKSKGIGPQVITILAREGMLERVRFGGECDDVKAIYPKANEDRVMDVPPGVTRETVRSAHDEGKFVIASYTANHHELDLAGMRESVAAGVDAIFVDYPRIGADAVGKPVETKLAWLVKRADSGDAVDRGSAILEIAKYDGFPTQALFQRWLLEKDDRVSRAAAIALVISHPAAKPDQLLPALQAANASARKNSAWAMGMLHAPAPLLLPLLNDSDTGALQEALLALSRCPGEIPAKALLPFLAHASPLVRGGAALALARHDPDVAVTAVPAALYKDEEFIADDYAKYVQRGKPKLTQQEIDPIVLMYRGQMKIVQAEEFLPEKQALPLLELQAFRSVEDYSLVAGLVAGYQLWDRIEDDLAAAISALNSKDVDIANRAEWMLVKAGPGVLPAVRKGLDSPSATVRERCVRILAWQGDAHAIEQLRAFAQLHPDQSQLVDWAIEKIRTLSFQSIRP
jgi:glycerophosphoryl diester phosphodiesterase